MAMIDNPVVSVLMICYNQEEYIGKAIRSVMRQKTTFPVELIIHDDCSIDRTGEICKEYANLYPDRICYVRNEKNVGLEENFIRAYRLTKGKYIAICEGDDYWLGRKKLQRQVDVMEAHPEYAICFHRTLNYYMRDNSKSLTAYERPAVTTIYDLARKNYISNVSCLYRKQPFDLPEWTSEVRTYDYAMHLLNACYGKIVFLPQVMAVYRIHGRSVWSESGAEKRYEIALKVRECVMRHFTDTHPDIAAILGEKYLENAKALLRHYQKHELSEKFDVFLAYVQTMFPDFTATDVNNISAQGNGKSLFRKFLTFGRRQVSKLLPLPGSRI